MMPLQRLKNALKTPWQRTLYIMFFAQLLTAVGFSSIFPFLPLYVHKLGSTTGTSLELLSGLVYSGQAFTMMLTAPLWGALADRYGRKLMVERAMFGGTLILLVMAFARSAEELVILRAIQGLITGTMAAANALVAAQTPREHSGYAMGLLQVGQGAGVALGPIAGGVVADAYGYSAAFYITSLLLLVGGLMVWLGIKEPAGQRMDGSSRPSVFGVWRQILSSPGVPVNYSLGFMSSLARNMLLPILPLFIPLLLVSTQSVNTFTGLIVGVSSGTTTISSIYFGRLGDRVGHRKILVTSLIAGGLLFIPQMWVNAAWQVLVLQAIIGIALGGVIPCYSALLARYTRPGLEGAVYGLDNAIGSGARAMAPMLGSAVAVSLGLRPAFAITAAILVMAGLVGMAWLPRRELAIQPPPVVKTSRTTV
jgi:MFS transporter, DHA1 family, multidrug resistance protein